jgi:predicted PurR-regulated permease PerM
VADGNAATLDRRGVTGSASAAARFPCGSPGTTFPMPPERIVSFRPRTILQTAALLVGLAAALWVVWIARHVLTWVLISLFLALALNPGVEWLGQRGVARRGAAAAMVYLLALGAIVLLALVFIPPLVDQVNGLVDAAPGYVNDLTAGRGPLGFLERDYHVVDKVREAVSGNGAARLAGGASTALSLTKGVITFVAGLVTIIFMTFFMLLEGATWMERAYGLMRPESRPRWRSVGSQIYRTISGYVTGNLAISVLAGVSSAIVLAIVGVPYALALGLLVAVLDLIPLAGATLAGIILGIVAFLTSTTAGIVVVAFFVIYQQLENHLLQPLIYGRTVQLSPLTVLIAVLIGAEVAGVLGALMAIPVAGTLQVLIADWQRRPAPSATGEPAEGPKTGQAHEAQAL